MVAVTPTVGDSHFARPQYLRAPTDFVLVTLLKRTLKKNIIIMEILRLLADIGRL